MSTFALVRTVVGVSVPVPTKTQWNTIANALRVAAEIYDKDRETFQKGAAKALGLGDPMNEAQAFGRLARQFSEQATEARDLAIEIEAWI